MNKRMIFGMSIFFALIIALLSISVTYDVNAQSIINGNSNTSVSQIHYLLNLSELNAKSSYSTYFDLANNYTILTNISSNTNYTCMLDIGAYYYIEEGAATITNTPADLILINTTLAETLTDGVYDSVLSCDYLIHTANTTILNANINGTNTTINTTIENTEFNNSLEYQKSIIIDSNAPIISSMITSEVRLNLSNASLNTSNNFYSNDLLDFIVPIQFSIIDLSNVSCRIIPLLTLNNSNSSNNNNSNYSDFNRYIFAKNSTYVPNIVSSSLVNLTIGNITVYSLTNNTFVVNIDSRIINVSMLFAAANNLSVYQSGTSGNQTNVLGIVPFKYNIECSDLLTNVVDTQFSSDVILNITRTQNISNSSNTTNSTNDLPYFNLAVSQNTFNLGELGYYNINANNNSNVTITICPLASGWVQCYATPTFVNEVFPKNQALPYTNKTGRYLIEGVMRYKNYTITRNITYETVNSLTASITASKWTAGVGDTLTFNATASSGISPYTFRWTLDGGTTFTGPGAYKQYATAGTYKVNLSVNDSSGNKFNTSIDVTIKNYYTMTIVVSDKDTSSRIKDALIEIGSNSLTTDSNGISSIKLLSGSYDVYVSKSSYSGFMNEVLLSKDTSVYLNMSFVDVTPPTIYLLTANDSVLAKDAVDLKFKVNDVTKVYCSLYVANLKDSWYALKDYGDDLLSDTEYTFELRDLDYGSYKWKLECKDKNQNSVYSEERRFIVPNNNVSTALTNTDDDADGLNYALDSLNSLSGDESDLVETLGIRANLEDLLERINRMEKDLHDLSYRRDLNESGRQDAQNKLIADIAFAKANTPLSLKITDSKTFVKYAKDSDLNTILGEYVSIKNMNFDKKMFFESTKLAQSKVIISTRVRNVELFYLNGESSQITLVIRDIQAAKPEDDLALSNSNSAVFVESVPKSIAPSAKLITVLTKDYKVIKDDLMIEFTPATRRIVYYLNGTIRPELLQNADTVFVDKNVNALKSSTGFSIFGSESIAGIGDISGISGFSLSDLSNLSGQSVMIILIIVLVLFYVVVNFDLIDKIRKIFTRASSKKKISFIRVLINDAIDYLKNDDYDKATLIYREIQLSYEGAGDAVKREVYAESLDLCNQLDLKYAVMTLARVEAYIQARDKFNAISEFDKLTSTYNKIDSKYRDSITLEFQRANSMMKGL
jgi:hypothetical protein